MCKRKQDSDSRTLTVTAKSAHGSSLLGSGQSPGKTPTVLEILVCCACAGMLADHDSHTTQTPGRGKKDQGNACCSQG